MRLSPVAVGGDEREPVYSLLCALRFKEDCRLEDGAVAALRVRAFDVADLVVGPFFRVFRGGSCSIEVMRTSGFEAPLSLKAV